MLVVDDDRVIRMVVRDALEAAGHRVIEASDADEGMRRAVDELPDLIILDVMLPRVDGLQLLSDMIARGVRARVLVFSATGARSAERARALGASGYLHKPFEVSELCKRVEALLRPNGDADAA